MRWQTLARTALHEELADWLAAEPGIVRVAVDGAPAAAPDDFASLLQSPLRARGRPVAHVRASTFWRDAALRFEPGREDVESYLSWLDEAALRREVLDAAVTARTYLPSLRDPATNRSTREPARDIAPETVLLVSGSLLLGRALPFERTIHLTLTPAALAENTPPSESWTLPAYERYAATVRPDELADVVIRSGRRDLAVRGLPVK